MKEKCDVAIALRTLVINWALGPLMARGQIDTNTQTLICQRLPKEDLMCLQMDKTI